MLLPTFEWEFYFPSICENFICVRFMFYVLSQQPMTIFLGNQMYTWTTMISNVLKKNESYKLKYKISLLLMYFGMFSLTMFHLKFMI